MNYQTDKIDCPKQIIGINENMYVPTIEVNLSEILDRDKATKLKLDLFLTVKGCEYFFCRLYSIAEIPLNGIIMISNIGLIGDITEEDEIKVRAIMTYLNAPC